MRIPSLDRSKRVREYNGCSFEEVAEIVGQWLFAMTWDIERWIGIFSGSIPATSSNEQPLYSLTLFERSKLGILIKPYPVTKPVQSSLNQTNISISKRKKKKPRPSDSLIIRIAAFNCLSPRAFPPLIITAHFMGESRLESPLDGRSSRYVTLRLTSNRLLWQK